MAARPEPKPEAEGLVFVTARGRHWLSGGIANPISVMIRDRRPPFLLGIIGAAEILEPRIEADFGEELIELAIEDVARGLG